MPTSIDCQQVIEIGPRLIQAINDLEDAAGNLNTYITEITSLLPGSRMQIPDRYQNWKTVIGQITDEMNQTKVQLQNIVARAEELIDIIGR